MATSGGPTPILRAMPTGLVTTITATTLGITTITPIGDRYTTMVGGGDRRLITGRVRMPVGGQPMVAGDPAVEASITARAAGWEGATPRHRVPAEAPAAGGARPNRGAARLQLRAGLRFRPRLLIPGCVVGDLPTAAKALAETGGRSAADCGSGEALQLRQDCAGVFDREPHGIRVELPGCIGSYLL